MITRGDNDKILDKNTSMRSLRAENSNCCFDCTKNNETKNNNINHNKQQNQMESNGK